MTVKKVKVTLHGMHESREYEGRCLGVIDGNEYNSIIKWSRLRKKLFSVETTPLKDVIELLENIEKQQRTLTEDGHLRLAFAVKTCNGHELLPKRLLVTEPLSYVSTIKGNNELELVGDSEETFISIEES